MTYLRLSPEKMEFHHVLLAFGLINATLFVIIETLRFLNQRASVVDWFIPTRPPKMDQETLNAVFRRAVREGNVEDVKKYIAQGAGVHDIHYDLALEGGHKDLVEYLHTLGLPDLRSAKLLRMVAHGYNALADNAIKAGAVPTAEHLAVANEAMRPLLETAMGAPAPVSDEYRIPVELVFTRTGTLYVKTPDTLKTVPSYVVDGTYRTSFTYTLTRRTKTPGSADLLTRRTQGPAALPQPVLPAPPGGATGPAAPAGYVPPTHKEPRVLRLRSRKITYV